VIFFHFKIPDADGIHQPAELYFIANAAARGSCAREGGRDIRDKISEIVFHYPSSGATHRLDQAEKTKMSSWKFAKQIIGDLPGFAAIPGFGFADLGMTK